MATVKVNNRHDALACESKPKGKHKVSTNAHKKGHLEIGGHKLPHTPKSRGKKRSAKK
jgi:hypothetical protein